ncbi:MAG: aminotransferase class V-fold PLP-dependent enzyme, partial [Chloroflexota bacterium]
MTFDVEAIRKKFPSIHKNKAVFFDNPAGTQVPEMVMSAVQDYYLYANANSGGAFVTSRRSDELTRRARHLVADMLNAPDAMEIVFGPNMTTLNFGLSRAI